MNAPELVLALDVGSTWCKAAYIDRAGRTVASGQAWVRDHRRFAHDEAALAHIWQGIRKAIDVANDQIGGDSPATFAVAARKAPGIWLDDNSEAVGLSQNVVSTIRQDDIDACYRSPAWGDDDPFAYGYGLDLIGNTRWLWRNRPKEWSRVRRAGILHSWILYRLTGRWATSHAGGPVLSAWPDTVRALTSLAPAAYPEVVADRDVLGPLLPQAAGELGLPEGIPVVAGTHDGAAANIGAGALHPGDSCLTFGTNGVLRVVTRDRIPARFGYTITSGRWALVRDLPDLALLLDTVVKKILDQNEPVTPDQHRELTFRAAEVPIGARGLYLKLFPDSPGLTVEQALVSRLGFAAIYRAALEAIALGFAGLERQARQAGTKPTRFFATGGATDNELLMRITSACLASPIQIPAGEAGLLGVAALAATGAGWFATVDEAAATMASDYRTVDSSADERSAYREVIETTALPTGIAPGDGTA